MFSWRSYLLDTIKYEVDKETGYLKVDRPQKFSNIIPALYGFVPQTYCEDAVKDLAVANGSVDVKEGEIMIHWIFVFFSSHNINGGGYDFRSYSNRRL